MLKEISDLTQTSKDLKRRWFSDPLMDLYVWYDRNDDIAEFQISYDKDADERVLAWSTKTGFTAHGVDSGSRNPQHMKSSPILTETARQDLDKVRVQFVRAGQKLEHDLYQFILERLAGT